MSVDTGYPKVLFSKSGSYDRAYPLDACRDREGNFWVVGCTRPSGGTYFEHWVIKLNSNWTKIREWVGRTDFSDTSWDDPLEEHEAVGGITIRSNDEVFIGLSARHSSDNYRHMWAAKLSDLDDTTWDVFKEVCDDKGAPYIDNPYVISDIAVTVNGQDDVCFYWRGSGYESVSPAVSILTFRIYKAADTWTDTGALESDEKGYGCAAAGVVPHPGANQRFWTGGYFGGSNAANRDLKWYTFDTPAGNVISFTLKYNQAGSDSRQGDGVPRNFVLDTSGANRHMFVEDFSDSNRFKINKDGSGDYYPSTRVTYPYVASFNQANKAKFLGYDVPTLDDWSAYQKTLSSNYNAGYDGEDTVDLNRNAYVCPVVKVFPKNDGKYFSWPKTGHLFLLSQNTTDIYGIAFDNLSWEPVTVPSAVPWIDMESIEVVAAFPNHHRHPSMAVGSDGTVHITWKEGN